jgi:hypothetical protein
MPLFDSNRTQAAFLVGRFLSSQLASEDRLLSPFNVAQSTIAPAFDECDVQALLRQYEAQQQRTMPGFALSDSIIKDIWTLTEGASTRGCMMLNDVCVLADHTALQGTKASSIFVANASPLSSSSTAACPPICCGSVRSSHSPSTAITS